MATVQASIIVPALREIAAIQAGEEGTTAEVTDAFDRLNMMLDTWATDNLTIPSVTRTTATITANQASYTVGASANINIAKPVFIEKVNFQDTFLTPDMEYSLGDLLTEQQYAAIPMKALTAPYPISVYWNPTYITTGYGTLTPWPIPTSTTLQWVVYAWTAIVQFSTLSETVVLPPGYREALTTNLAVLLTTQWGRQPHPVLVKRASDSLASIKRANKRQIDVTFGADALGDRGNYGPGRWDIRTGP